MQKLCFITQTCFQANCVRNIPFIPFNLKNTQVGNTRLSDLFHVYLAEHVNIWGFLLFPNFRWNSLKNGKRPEDYYRESRKERRCEIVGSKKFSKLEGSKKP